MLNIWTKLQGWKVHGVAWSWIAGCILEKVLGIPIEGFDPGADWLNTVFIALGVSAGRSTIASVVQMILDGMEKKA
jgi:hypothetical protein